MELVQDRQLGLRQCSRPGVPAFSDEGQNNRCDHETCRDHEHNPGGGKIHDVAINHGANDAADVEARRDNSERAAGSAFWGCLANEHISRGCDQTGQEAREREHRHQE